MPYWLHCMWILHGFCRSQRCNSPISTRKALQRAKEVQHLEAGEILGVDWSCRNFEFKTESIQKGSWFSCGLRCLEVVASNLRRPLVIVQYLQKSLSIDRLMLFLRRKKAWLFWIRCMFEDVQRSNFDIFWYIKNFQLMLLLSRKTQIQESFSNSLIPGSWSIWLRPQFQMPHIFCAGVTSWSRFLRKGGSVPKRSHEGVKKT